MTDQSVNKKALDTKEKILIAARNIFGQKGFYETKMDDIAREAGIAKGTLYLYFKSKEELYECLIKIGLNLIEQAILEILEAPKSFSEKLKEIIAYIIDILSDNREFVLRIMYEMPLAQIWKEDFKQKIFGEGQRLAESFRKFVIEGINVGFFNEYDPDILTNVLIGAITRPVFVYFLEKKDMERLKIDLFEVIKNAFCKPCKGGSL
ncbi:MAG: TetR/AcrR family transcriptional regulator [candidate division WOR-3 bacterium]